MVLNSIKLSSSPQKFTTKWQQCLTLTIFRPNLIVLILDKIYTKSTTGTKHLLISQRKRKKLSIILKKLLAITFRGHFQASLIFSKKTNNVPTMWNTIGFNQTFQLCQGQTLFQLTFPRSREWGETSFKSLTPGDSDLAELPGGSV